MFYKYVELEDGTTVVHSEVRADGSVVVEAERPAILDFDTARWVLPSYDLSNVRGFTEEEVKGLTQFVRNNAQLILKFAQEESREYA